jgi:ribosome maturation factor RimP
MIEKEQIRAEIESFIKDTDQFLVEVKLSPNRLTVCIDKPSGVVLEDCTKLSRHLNEFLDPSGFLETHELEVGSPGMDSPMLVPQQYLRRIGREMKVVTADGIELKGVLTEATSDGIELLETISKKENKKKIISEVLHKISFSDIREAKLILNFKFK